MTITRVLPYFIFKPEQDFWLESALKNILLVFQCFRAPETMDALLPHLGTRNIQWLTKKQIQGIRPRTLENLDQIRRQAFEKKTVTHEFSLRQRIAFFSGVNFYDNVVEFVSDDKNLFEGWQPNEIAQVQYPIHPLVINKFTLEQQIAYFNSSYFVPERINEYTLTKPILNQLSLQVLHAVDLSSIDRVILFDPFWMPCFTQKYEGILSQLSQEQIKDLIENHANEFTYDQLVHVFLGGTTPEQRSTIDFNLVVSNISSDTCRFFLRFKGVLNNEQILIALKKCSNFKERIAGQFDIPLEENLMRQVLPKQFLFPLVEDSTIHTFSREQVLSILPDEFLQLSGPSLVKIKQYVFKFSLPQQQAYFTHPQFDISTINYFVRLFINHQLVNSIAQLPACVIPGIQIAKFSATDLITFLPLLDSFSIQQRAAFFKKFIFEMEIATILGYFPYDSKYFKIILSYLNEKQSEAFLERADFPKKYASSMPKKKSLPDQLLNKVATGYSWLSKTARNLLK